VRHGYDAPEVVCAPQIIVGRYGVGRDGAGGDQDQGRLGERRGTVFGEECLDLWHEEGEGLVVLTLQLVLFGVAGRGEGYGEVEQLVVDFVLHARMEGVVVGCL
jgi:hypothetical protein